MSYRLIGDNLYLGDTFTPSAHDFEYVVTLEQESNDHTTHHFPLIDGPQHSVTRFETAVTHSTELLEKTDEDVLIHCTAGINRSGAVGTVVWALHSDDSFGQSLSKCQCGFHDIASYFEDTSREIYEMLK